MLTPELLRSTFAAGLSYDDYVSTGRADQQANWRAFHARVELTPAQRALIGGFTRRIHVLVSSGVWCGDCVQQCPMLDHIARANPAGPDGDTRGIMLRFVDRDAHAELSSVVKICGGARVPVAIFMNEDFEFVSLLGDKTLSRFRAAAAKQLGAACALPGAAVPQDEVAETLADWVAEFERVHLLLRLSAKLRQRHGD